MQPSETPSFDTWTSSFLFAVAFGIFLFFVLAFGKNKKNQPIAFFILAFSLILFQYVLYWTQYQFTFHYLVLLPHVCYYCVGPLLYLYLLKVYQKPVSKLYSLHFIPAFLVLMTYVAFLSIRLGLKNVPVPWRWFSVNPWLIVIHLIIYNILIGALLWKSQKKSNLEQLLYRWSKILSLLFIGFTLAYVSYYVLVRFSFFDSTWDYGISLMMSLSIYTIGYFSIKQPKIFDGEFLSKLFFAKENAVQAMDYPESESIYQKLISYMNLEKPYTNNELRMVHLADQLGVPLNMLSKIINTKSNKNFNQFVNDYRLKEAQRLLLEHPNEPIKTIYFEVGFNNKATFYSAFKDKYQCTPSQFRKTHISS